MTSKELQDKLEAMKKEQKKKEKELRKEIAKQKRKEEREFTIAVGKICRKYFPQYATPDAFEMYFRSLTEQAHEQVQEEQNPYQSKPSYGDANYGFYSRLQDPSESHQSC